ncbi:hypothetical protein VN0416_11060 [Helicobacter pylori]
MIAPDTFETPLMTIFFHIIAVLVFAIKSISFCAVSRALLTVELGVFDEFDAESVAAHPDKAQRLFALVAEFV